MLRSLPLGWLVGGCVAVCFFNANRFDVQTHTLPVEIWGGRDVSKAYLCSSSPSVVVETCLPAFRPTSRARFRLSLQTGPVRSPLLLTVYSLQSCTAGV
jgi:hypothetical protein